MTELADFLAQVQPLLARLERLLPPALPQVPDMEAHSAFRWRRLGGYPVLEPISHPHRIALEDLQGVARQAALVERNTRQFVCGLPANNVLLTGARGTGKSSLVKAVLNRFSPEGLRLVEVDKRDLMDLPDIISRLADLPYRFLLFSDDLSFNAEEPGYTSLKAVLDGSVAATPENMLIYATSNRRHLMPEYMEENLQARHVGEEIHPGETVEEKISLSERFGLWVSFYPFDQAEYLAIVRHWLQALGCSDTDSEAMRLEAVQWALQRGSRSGRVAWHFARDWAGRRALAARPS